MPPAPDSVGDAVRAFVEARTWAESKRVVEDRRDLLLTDTADAFLLDLLEQYKEDESVTRLLGEHRDLLRRCRDEGIEAAFVPLLADASVPNPLTDAVLAFVNARTPDEMRQLVEAHRGVLLTDPADALLADLMEQYRDQPGATEQLRARRALLERLRRGEGEDAFVSQPEAAPSDPLATAVLAFVNARTWSESKEVVQDRRDLLLTDAADQFLADLLDQYKGDEGAIRLLDEHRALLARCREEGIDAAFADRLSGPRVPDRLVEAVLAFVNARTWAETKQVAADRRDLLMTDAADAVLAHLHAQNAGDDAGARHIEQHRALLERCRREGIDAAFADLVAEVGGGDLGRLLEQLGQLTGRNDLPRRVAVCRAALELVERDTQPDLWAALQVELANSLAQNPLGDRAENLERAIEHYRQALAVYTREAFPADWAMTQNNLANAYRNRIRGERAENLERAIEHYRQALAVFGPKTFPQSCRNSAYSLGRLLYAARRFAEARSYLALAHDAIEALRGETQREGARRSLAEENADLYARLVHCCLVEGDEEAAFAYAAAGKGRAFVDLLATARVDIAAAGADDPALAADLRKARDLRRQIDALFARLSGEGGTPAGEQDQQDRRALPALYAEMLELRGQEERLWQDLAFMYPALTATQQAPTLSPADARGLAADLDATLVEYYRHARGWGAFVATAGGTRYVPLPRVDDTALVPLLDWLSWIESPCGRGDLSYEPLAEWHAAFIAPLREHFPRARSVVLAPFSWLHLVPLAAARDPKTGQYVGDEYDLAFVPSLGALRVARDQANKLIDGAGGRADSEALCAAYPGPPDSPHFLPNVVREAQAIAGHFARVTPLYEAAATTDAVVAGARGKDVVHLGCHGWFDADQPTGSGLILADGWLTVQRIVAELRLDRTRLTTVGACLGGRIDVRPGEEHVGLVQALLAAGTPAVVAGLWSVHDAATRALLEAFYTELDRGASPARALRVAARGVRRYPGWEHPFFWAAFRVSGLAHEPILASATDGSADAEERVAAIHDEKLVEERTRGGATVSATQVVRDTRTLLAQMTRYVGRVRATLDDRERPQVAAALGALADQALRARSDADLLAVANAIHHLVEETPTLRALLLPSGMDVEATQAKREVTIANHEATGTWDDQPPQTYFTIVNALVDLRGQLAEPDEPAADQAARLREQA